MPAAAVRTCVDVGASRGQSVQSLTERFINADVYSFEPLRSQFTVLNELYGKTPRVALIKSAVGAVDGEIEMNECESRDCSSVLDTTGRLDSHNTALMNMVRRETVPICRIDTWAQDRGLQHIDFLKSDTQGYDLEVLKGCEGLLRERRIEFVQVEVFLENAYEGQASLEQICSYMKQWNYRLLGLYHTARCPENKWITWGDLLFRCGNFESV